MSLIEEVVTKEKPSLKPGRLIREDQSTREDIISKEEQSKRHNTYMAGYLAGAITGTLFGAICGVFLAWFGSN